MNTSSNTKTNLISRGAVTGNPFVNLGWVGVIFVLITVSVFTILVKLGLWQLDRAEQKKVWHNTLVERQQQAELTQAELIELMRSNPEMPLTGFKLNIIASPVSDKILLLDNQVFNGQVGYLAYQIFRQNDVKSSRSQDNKSTPAILIELGFVPANNNRQILPIVAPYAQGEYSISGRIYQKEANPLSNELYLEQGNPMRFQNLAIDKLSQAFNMPLLPIALQPNDIPHLNLSQPWQPIPLSAQKHQGYAVQWFSMSAVFIGLMSYLAFKKWQRIYKNNNK